MALLKKLGTIDSCPYCKKKLEKIPERKKKCDFCSKYIYVRTRPIDKKKVLIKENEIKEMEMEWINYATASYWFKELEKLGIKKDDFVETYYKLKEKFGATPMIEDVLWGVFNNALLDAMKEGDKDKDSSIRVLMDKFKEKESKGEKIWDF